jgi:hypothetical protein
MSCFVTYRNTRNGCDNLLKQIYYASVVACFFIVLCWFIAFACVFDQISDKSPYVKYYFIYIYAICMSILIILIIKYNVDYIQIIKNPLFVSGINGSIIIIIGIFMFYKDERLNERLNELLIIYNYLIFCTYIIKFIFDIFLMIVYKYYLLEVDDLDPLKKLNTTKYRSYSKIEKCDICLDEYVDDDNIIILKCSHKFHEKCFLLHNKNFCPYCNRIFNL